MKSLEVVEKLKARLSSQFRLDPEKQVNDWELLLQYYSEKDKRRYNHVRDLKGMMEKEINYLLSTFSNSMKMKLTRDVYENNYELEEYLELKESILFPDGSIKVNLPKVIDFLSKLTWERIALESNGYDVLSREELQEFEFVFLR